MFMPMEDSMEQLIGYPHEMANLNSNANLKTSKSSKIAVLNGHQSDNPKQSIKKPTEQPIEVNFSEQLHNG